MEGRYPPALLVTLTDCIDPAAEEQFCVWQEQVLIPALSSLGWVHPIMRFRNVLAGGNTYQGFPRYLTLAEVQREPSPETWDGIVAVRSQLDLEGRGFSGTVSMVDALYARTGGEIQTERTGQPLTGVYLVFSYCRDGKFTEFDQWYDEVHGPEVLALGQYHTAYRYVAAIKHPTIPEYLTVYETSSDPLGARNGLVASRSLWGSNPIWTSSLGLCWTGGFARVG